MRQTLGSDAGFDRLQQFLLEMEPGDQLSAQRASEISGLDHRQCDTILGTLVRAGVMMRLQHDAYVRCRLAQADQQV